MNFDPIFECGDRYYLILLDSLKYVLNEHKANLFAYVFMPSHIHLVVAMPEGESLSDFMRDFKKFTSTKIRRQLGTDGHELLLNRLRENAVGQRDQQFKLWMDRFDDLVITSEATLRVKINYIHENPVRAGLVDSPEKWQFSSARNYSHSQNGLIGIDTDWTAPLQPSGSNSRRHRDGPVRLHR